MINFKYKIRNKKLFFHSALCLNRKTRQSYPFLPISLGTFLLEKYSIKLAYKNQLHSPTLEIRPSKQYRPTQTCRAILLLLLLLRPSKGSSARRGLFMTSSEAEKVSTLPLLAFSPLTNSLG